MGLIGVDLDKVAYKIPFSCSRIAILPCRLHWRVMSTAKYL